MTTTLTTRQEFNRQMEFFARELTTLEITGTKALIIGIEIKAIADSFDISELTLEFLQNELELRKSHFFLDGHNWSDFRKAISDNKVQIIERLCIRKQEVGA